MAQSSGPGVATHCHTPGRVTDQIYAVLIDCPGHLLSVLAQIVDACEMDLAWLSLWRVADDA